MRIKITTSLRWPIERQILDGIGKEHEFNINDSSVLECDAWIIYQGLNRPESARCPPENVILFTYEPPGLHNYLPQFLKQFSKIVTCHRTIQHPDIVYRHQAQPWLAGLCRDNKENIHSSDFVTFTADDFLAMKPPYKSRMISVLCSNKAMTQGHRRRLAFVETLQRTFGKDLDIFGYGFQPLADKWDGLSKYKYHIVLENSTIEDYWSEKLADAYLGYCFPIVSGCLNLDNYFSNDAYLPIDVDSPEQAANMIQNLIEQDPYKDRLPAIGAAREKILGEYNLFSEIPRLIKQVSASNREKITLKDERLFMTGGFLKPLVRPIKDWVAR